MIKPQNSKVFYGWYIIGFGTLGVLMSVPGQTIGISTFTDYLIEALDLTRGQLSMAYLLGTISSSLLLVYGGRMYDRYGARKVSAVAAVGMGLVLIYLSFSEYISKSAFSVVSFVPEWMVSSFVVFIGFFLLRFFGQGVLTMGSRNMIMEWFEQRRGLANALSGPFIALGFAITPLLFDSFINLAGWQWTWRYLAIFFGFGFSIVILIFYYDKPEKAGLQPDGNMSAVKKQKSEKKNKIWYPYALKEARKNFAFWVFIVSLSMFSLYLTGFTFHVVSVFEEVGISRERALATFIPSSVIAFLVNIIGSWLSDYVKLKHLYKIMAVGGVLSTIGLVSLEYDWAYYTVIIGTGILHGMFGVLSPITWPKYFGRKHLGAISGFSQSFNVFFSALGPLIFSQSLTLNGSYQAAGYIVMGVWILLFIASFFANNPQEKWVGHVE